MEQPRASSKRRRGIYLLPNLFTTAALFAGFYAVTAAMNQRYELAAVSIFIAMILDGLDGRVARLTNTQSAFGAEYDSLADMISFGAAPALVMYTWSLASVTSRGCPAPQPPLSWPASSGSAKATASPARRWPTRG